MSMITEPEKWGSIKRSFGCSERERSGYVELARPLINLPRSLSGYTIGILIDVAPICRRIGPYHQPEALNKAVTAGAPQIAPVDVLIHTNGLSAADH
jgi:hypothetical protein